jgi:hypothetical protein
VDVKGQLTKLRETSTAIGLMLAYYNKTEQSFTTPSSVIAKSLRDRATYLSMTTAGVWDAMMMESPRSELQLLLRFYATSFPG